jgi:squalene-hopene/tetraprenyl-beta-curcumene cyclase
MRIIRNETPIERLRARLAIGFAIISVSRATVAFAQPNGTPPDKAAWNPRTAAEYLDARQGWWLKWPTAARDHETSCVSCHTALPYALARPALRQALGESQVAEPERRLIENVVKRVALWRDVEPFYPDQTRGLPKTSESRGTEAVLNALILATRDARAGTLTDDARRALDNMWALQFRAGDQKGAWAWLNFHNEPWEANGSPYFGAALAAIAVGTAPGGYASSPEIQDRLTMLRAYLQRGADTASVFNRVMALWASGLLPTALATQQRQAIIDTVFAKQREDGGWSMSQLASWKRGDGTPQDSSSDGYATGLVVLALERAGVADQRVRRGVDWLSHHQDASTGAWFASSLNKKRDPSSDVGKFMIDAATAYAVMALAAARP